MTWDAVVVGGGVTGLAAAYHLRKKDPRQNILLLESSRRIGGKLLSFEDKGFLFEGGADGLLFGKAGIDEVLKDLGLEEEIITPPKENRGSYVRFQGKLHPMPEGLSGLIPRNMESLKKSALLTSQALDRFLREPEVPFRRDTQEESLAQFFTRRFGAQAYERLFEPLLSGIFAGDARLLGIDSTFPQLSALERSGKSLLNSPVPPPQEPARGFISFKGGMETLVRRLWEKLRHLPGPGKVEILTGQRVTDLSRDPRGGWIVKAGKGHHLAEGIILSVGPTQAAGLLSKSHERASEILRAIPMASVTNLNLGFYAQALPDLPPGTGFVVPALEQTPFSACTWLSRKWAHRCPEDQMVLRFYFGGVRRPGVWNQNADTLMNWAMEEVRQWSGGKSPGVLASRVFRWKEGIPQLNVGHRDLISRLETLLPQDLRLAGAYFDGVGIPDCLASARRAAHGLGTD